MYVTWKWEHFLTFDVFGWRRLWKMIFSSWSKLRKMVRGERKTLPCLNDCVLSFSGEHSKWSLEWHQVRTFVNLNPLKKHWNIIYYISTTIFYCLTLNHGVYTSTGGLLLAFMLLEQLFKVAPCWLVRDLAGTLSFSFCQTAHDLKKLAVI